MPTTTLPSSPSDPDFRPLSTAVPSVPEVSEPPGGGPTGAVIVICAPDCSNGPYGYRSSESPMQGFPCCHLVSSTDSLAFGPQIRPSSSLCPDRHQALQPTATGRQHSVAGAPRLRSTSFRRPSSSNSSKTGGHRLPPSPPLSGCRRRPCGSGCRG